MTSRDRLKGAVAAIAVQALLGWVLIAGLATNWRRLPEQALAVFQVAPPPPPPPPAQPPTPVRRSTHKDAAAPPNLRSRAADVVAPPPVLPVLFPPPVIAAPLPSTGFQSSIGAAPVAGPGTGARGIGRGTGGGGSGAGMGDRAGDGTPPRWRHGELKDSDYPREAGQQGTGGKVGVRYLVGTDGRVGVCEIVRPSGSADLDDTTCRLIRQRFRFAPSRDARGKPVPAWVVETHEWVIDWPVPPAG